MNTLNIVLVEPEIPQNTGNIARTCAATGAALHLVEPLAFQIDEKHLRRAGLDYWQYLEVYTYKNIDELFEKYPDGNFYYFTTKSKKRYTDIQYSGNVFLVFGKETKGLPEPLLKANPETSVRIPMVGDLRSLNLSNSAAIGVYEVLRQRGFEGLNSEGHFHEL